MHSRRRQLLDRFLQEQSVYMKGDILDIGGKREGKRGQFRPPSEGVRSWRYLNIDSATSPDLCCDAESIPLPDCSVDGFLLCEVLEHVLRPDAVLQEAFRVLRPGGRGWITMPFLCHVHGDPDDYQRWTHRKLHIALAEVGFSSVTVIAMGGVVEVIDDLLSACLKRSSSSRGVQRLLAKALSRSLRLPLSLLERGMPITSDFATTGWAAVARKV